MSNVKMVLDFTFGLDDGYVLDTFIATLFKKFKDTLELNSEEFNRPSFDEEAKIIKIFGNVYRQACIIRRYWDIDLETSDLDSLSILVDTTNLEANIKYLVAEYLKWVNGGKVKPGEKLDVIVEDFSSGTYVKNNELFKKYLIQTNIEYEYVSGTLGAKYYGGKNECTNL